MLKSSSVNIHVTFISTSHASAGRTQRLNQSPERRIENILMKKSEMRNARLAEMRRAKAKLEMAECTFKPAIRKSSRTKSRIRRDASPGNRSTLFQRALVSQWEF